MRSLGETPEDQQNDFDAIVNVQGFKASDDYKTEVKRYQDICKALQSLSFAGDNLWFRATEEYLKAFAHALQKAKRTIENNAIYFESSDLANLRHVVGTFERFRVGKERLIEMRSVDIDGLAYGIDTSQESIENQIHRNGEFKKEYDALVEKIRTTFKARIS